jgi:hypothetical protein
MYRVENTVHCYTPIVSVGTCLFTKALLSNGCVYLLRICCPAADIVSLFVSRSLLSNESTCYNMKILHQFCSHLRRILTHIYWKLNGFRKIR